MQTEKECLQRSLSLTEENLNPFLSSLIYKSMLRPTEKKICQVIASFKRKINYFQRSKNYRVSTEGEILIAERQIC